MGIHSFLSMCKLITIVAAMCRHQPSIDYLPNICFDLESDTSFIFAQSCETDELRIISYIYIYIYESNGLEPFFGVDR